jgi:hypothetical protein
VDELAVVGQQQQAGGVLVEPADGLHALHRALVGPQPQRRRQQRVDARVGRGLLRALGAGRLVQQQVGLLVVRPPGALDGEKQALGVEVFEGVVDHGARNGHVALLDQARAHAPCAEALGIEDVLQMHGK